MWSKFLKLFHNWDKFQIFVSPARNSSSSPFLFGKNSETTLRTLTAVLVIYAKAVAVFREEQHSATHLTMAVQVTSLKSENF